MEAEELELCGRLAILKRIAAFYVEGGVGRQSRGILAFSLLGGLPTLL